MTALYLPEDELRLVVAPHLSRPTFARLVGQLELRGFPKPHPLFKARYLPAVRVWLDNDAGLGKSSPMAIDGEETWDGPTKRDAGAEGVQSQNRTAKALLERGEPLDQGEGLSRKLDPFTARRHARRDRGPVPDLRN
jgi:hypothetical protein